MAAELPHICVDEINHPIVTVSERGKSVSFINCDGADYQRVHVDGCLIKDGRRADYIVTKVGVRSVVIELKGRDVEHACEQVFATVNRPECVDWLAESISLLIVCAKYPSFDTRVARFQLRARKMGMRLKIACRNLSCEIEAL